MGGAQEADEDDDVLGGEEDQEEVKVRSSLACAGEDANRERARLVSSDNRESVKSGASGMTLDPPIHLRRASSTTALLQTPQHELLAADSASNHSPSDDPTRSTAIHTPPPKRNNRQSSPFRFSSSLSEYRSPAKSVSASPRSPHSPHTPASSTYTPSSALHRRYRGLGPASFISPTDSVDSVGSDTSPLAADRRTTLSHQKEAEARLRMPDSITPVAMRVERMTDSRAIHSSSRFSSSPTADRAGRMSPLQHMSDEGANEGTDPADASQDDAQPYEPYQNDWEWGNDAMLDWEGGHDDSFLHYEPDLSPTHAPTKRESDGEDSDIEIIPTDTSGDIETDTDPDIPLAGPSATRRSRALKEGGMSSKVPKKRALIDLTGSSGEIAITAPTAHELTTRPRRDTVTETETDASSVAPEDAGLDPEMLDDEEGGYDMGGDDWADWGNDAYLVYDADDGVTRYNDGVGSDDEVHDHVDEGDGDTTLTMANVPHRAERSPVREDQCGSKSTAKGKARALDTVDELLRRGMPDYSSWELKRLQKLCTSYGYRISTKHDALVKIAIDCWRALNPVPDIAGLPISPIIRTGVTATTRKPDSSPARRMKTSPGKRAAKPRTGQDAVGEPDFDEDAALEYAAMMEEQESEGDESDISSADVPLATTRAGRANGKGKKAKGSARVTTSPRAKSKGKAKGKAKAKAKAIPISSDVDSITSAPSATDTDAEAERDTRPMAVRFREMIHADPQLYLRILYYEPIHFDEFISRALKAGLKDRRDKGWKVALKKFLDFEGITFYTEDPTGGSRRRH